MAASVLRISRPPCTSRTRLSSSAGVGECPCLRACSSNTRLRPASSVTPTQHAGSLLNGVRPSNTKRALQSRAHSAMQAAVTPRAPPETSTTSPAEITDLPKMTGSATLRKVLRSPDAVSMISTSPPPSSNSFAISVASVLGSRPAVSRSMAFSDASGHSSAAVFTNAGKPDSQARRPFILPMPKLPPVSCKVTNRPRSDSRRGAKWRATAKASRLIAMACASSVTSRKPPR